MRRLAKLACGAAMTFGLAATSVAQEGAEPVRKSGESPAGESPAGEPPAQILAPPPIIPIPPPAPPPPPALSKAKPVPVTQLSSRETKLEWLQAPTLFIPAMVEAGSGAFKENQAIFEAPLVWALAGRLGEDVTIAGPGEPITLKAGTVLPRVALREGNRVDERFEMLCTPTRILQKEQNTGFLGKLEQNLMHSMRDAQWCLQDTDDDGRLDLAVVLNAGAPVTQAAPIQPVSYEPLGMEPIPGDENRLRFELLRVGKKDVGLWMSIKQRGKELKFNELTSGFYRVKRFSNIAINSRREGAASVAGILFKISEADRKGNSATIEWSAVSDRGPAIVIPTRLETTLRY